MTEKKKSFVLYVDRKKELDLLSDEQLGKLFRAIYSYVDTGIEPDFEDLALRILFSVFQSQIDANAEKYAETCRRRSENVKKRWEKQKNTKDTKECNCIQSYTNDTDTDTVTDTVTDTENNNDIYISGDKSPDPPAGGSAGRKDQNQNPKKSGSQKILQNIIAAYTQNLELQNALAGFVEMRNKIKKPLTERAMKSCLKKLDQFTSVDEMKIAIVDQSVERCWMTFYELKEIIKQKDNYGGGMNGNGSNIWNAGII